MKSSTISLDRIMEASPEVQRLISQIADPALPDTIKAGIARLLQAGVAAETNIGPIALTLSQSANYIQVSRTSLWRMISSGRLKICELTPGIKRIRRADLDTLLKQ